MRRGTRRARARSRRGVPRARTAPVTSPAAERGPRSCAARDAGFRPVCRTRRRERRRRSRRGTRRLSPRACRCRRARASPAASNRLASAPCGNSRIFTAYSSAGPGPPSDRRVDAAGDRHDLEVELGRESPIQTQLLFAEESPRRERREIEEAEIDCLLDLVRVRSGQQHERNVRLELRGRRDAAQHSRARERIRRALPDPSRRPRGSPPA